MPDGGLHLEAPGLWVEIRDTVASGSPRAALFLDRDGTVMVDTGYPRQASDVTLIPEMLAVLRAANTAGVPVVIVSNQSGIARGLLTWSDFAAVNAQMLRLLAAEGYTVSAVLACGYYRSLDSELDFADHPMRKPNPGMLQLAAERLDLDLARSIMVGDKPSDLVAGSRAGLSLGFLIGTDDVPEAPMPFRWSQITGPDGWADLVATVTACGQHR